MNTSLLREARAVLAAQPFSELLGTRVVAFDRGVASLRLDVRADLRQQSGYVHGGVLAYLADNVLTFAGGSVLGGGVVTVELKINYLRPVVGDGALVAEATVVGSGRSQAVCRCEIHHEQAGERKLVAAAQGTIARPSPPPANDAPSASTA